MFKNYLSALGLSYSFINKVYEVLVCIHLITILIQKVMIQCVISAVPRCVLNRLKVTRFKIQPTTTWTTTSQPSPKRVGASIKPPKAGIQKRHVVPYCPEGAPRASHNKFYLLLLMTWFTYTKQQIVTSYGVSMTWGGCITLLRGNKLFASYG